MQRALEDEASAGSAPARKKRIPPNCTANGCRKKACGSCRVSKLKCDGLRPCTRCHTLRKVCEFVERPRDPYEAKMEALEQEIESLKARLNTPSDSLSNSGPSPSNWSEMPLEDVRLSSGPQCSNLASLSGEQAAMARVSPGPPMAYTHLTGTLPSLHRRFSSVESLGGVASAVAPFRESPSLPRAEPLRPAGTSVTGSTGSHKRSRVHFEAGTPPTIPDLDPISAGLITPEAAASYFSTFFSGCERYVPVFDPLYDTLESVRRRSTLLFSALCWVGCRVSTGSESYHSRVLGMHTQRMLNVAIAAAPSRGGTQTSCLETVQALLVRACYAPERSLLVAVATRVALEIGLPEAYGVLSAHCVANPKAGMMGSTPFVGGSTPSSDKADEEAATLMRKTRTWLHLLMMSQILNVDAGGPPGFRFRGAAQRCRILLGSPSSTGIDLYLFSQVELNTIRARIHSTLASYVRDRPPVERDDDDIMEMVGDAKIDINVWFDDWTRIYEKHTPNMPWLTPNLAVQRCWADSMAMCAALRAAGIENVSAMSTTQREILGMTKRSLRQHLDIILEEPRVYLRSIRYAMDFVWAKNAFCYLLLLKLSILLPDNDGEGTTNDQLIEKGRLLVDEMSKSGGGLRDGTRNNTSGLYLHLVRLSIDKFSNAIRSPSQSGSTSMESQAHNVPDRRNGGVTRQGRGNGHEGGWPPDENQTELESFVPEQFVFEWDFPGLTFFSSPTHETGWLDELLAGAFDGAENFYSLGWASMDFNIS